MQSYAAKRSGERVKYRNIKKWPIEITLQAPGTWEGNFDHNKLFIYSIN